MNVQIALVGLHYPSIHVWNSFSTWSVNSSRAQVRGQCYDNASNMTRAYSGVHARFLKLNKSAVFLPCSAHSANLVGSQAADSCSSAREFFLFLQNLYSSFLLGEQMQNCLSSQSRFVVKSLSAIRWSARANAVKALKNYANIKTLLFEMSSNSLLAFACQNEARTLSTKMNHFETSLMLVIWDHILCKRETSLLWCLQCLIKESCSGLGYILYSIRSNMKVSHSSQSLKSLA